MSQTTRFALAGISLLLSAGLLSLASAPVGMWPLAWFALAPWLIAVAAATTFRAAFALGWLTACLYFAVNLWWLWTASTPGTVMLCAYFALYWSLAAGLIHALKFANRSDDTSSSESLNYHPLQLCGQVVAIAVVWVAAEWLRCHVASGFAWLPLGCTQSPLVAMCQVADIGGPWIVSFWVILPNALLAIAWFERKSPRRLILPAAMVAATLACVAIYGAWRLQSTVHDTGPRVMVIQSNVAHLPGGTPAIGHQQSVDILLGQVETSLAEQHADLVVLPEAALPPINDEARRELAPSPIGPFLEQTHARLVALSREHNVAILVGGSAVTGWTTRGREHIGSEIRNSAYLFDPRPQTAVRRYDKIYLARFSERAPITFGPTWLRAFATYISANRALQPLVAGSINDLTSFHLQWRESKADAQRTARFITPICLENIEPAVIARMMRNPDDPGKKRADFLANLSNDGWFAAQEKHQHLQTTIFRCIENRVPMARSSNTGISCFIDSCGRVSYAIAPHTAGFAVQSLQLDHRVTFYTRYGDVFAILCAVLVAAAVLIRLAALSLAFAQRIRAIASS